MSTPERSRKLVLRLRGIAEAIVPVMDKHARKAAREAADTIDALQQRIAEMERDYVCDAQNDTRIALDLVEQRNRQVDALQQDVRRLEAERNKAIAAQNQNAYGAVVLHEQRNALLADRDAQVREAEERAKDVALAVEACRDESLSDGACRFTVLTCLLPQPPVTEDDIKRARELFPEMFDAAAGDVPPLSDEEAWIQATARSIDVAVADNDQWGIGTIEGILRRALARVSPAPQPVPKESR